VAEEKMAGDDIILENIFFCQTSLAFHFFFFILFQERTAVMDEQRTFLEEELKTLNKGITQIQKRKGVLLQQLNEAYNKTEVDEDERKQRIATLHLRINQVEDVLDVLFKGRAQLDGNKLFIFYFILFIFIFYLLIDFLFIDFLF